MSANIQLIVGIIPATLLAVALVVLAKKQRLAWSVCLFLMCLSIGGAVIYANQNKTNEVSHKKTVTEASDSELFGFCYALAENEEYDLAKQVLEEAGKSCFYNYDYLLAYARMSALEGDMVQAEKLYETISEHALNSVTESCEDELEIIANKDSYSGNAAITQAMTDAIRNAISDDEDDKYDVAAQMYSKANSLLNSWNYYGSYDDTELGEVASWFESAQNDMSEVMSLSFMQDSFLGLEVVSGNYDELISDISDASGERLLVIAELLRLGAIDSDDFRNDKELSKQIKNCKHLEEWIEQNTADYEYTDEQQAVIDEAVQYASLFDSDDGAQLWVLELMEEKAEEEPENASQLNLEISHYYYDQDDEEKADRYFDSALECALASDDDMYYQAAENILYIINNPDDTEARKDVAEYAENLVEGVLPEQISNMEDYVIVPNDASDSDGSDIYNDDGSDTYNDDTEDNGDDSNHNSNSNGIFGGNGNSAGNNTWTNPGNGNASDGNGSNNDDSDYSSYGSSDTGSDYSDDSSDAVSGEKTKEDFGNYLSEEINLMGASITIASVNADNFDEVSAVVAVDTSVASGADEFKANLSLRDCGINIPDYSVEKLEYNTINLILCCDKSGSMSGEKIENLRNACSALVDNLSGQVNIGIVLFESGVSASIAPTSDAAELQSFISGISDGGGTNIYSGVSESIGLIQNTEDALNLVIVMSDGQDGYPSEETLRALQASCAEKNITLYTAGLGSDVDSGVLSSYSNVLGGNYLYIEDSSSIVKYYNFIYNLSLNTYRVTFNAVDTAMMNRNLYIEDKNSANTFASKDYYLYDRDITADDATGAGYEVTFGDTVVYGFDTKLLYQSDYASTIYLKGENFAKDDEMTLKIKAGVNYDLDCTYVDEQTYEVTIPAGVACGIYDLYVTFNGKNKTMEAELVVTNNSRNVVAFGDYVFTATNISDSGTQKVLSGVVCLNEWLYFRDSLTIVGNTENDYSVKLQSGRTYVQYDNSAAQGLVKFISDANYIVGGPKFYDYWIYNDPTKDSTEDEYPVDKATADNMLIQGLMLLNGNENTVSLYPDRMVIDFSMFTLKLPFADNVSDLVAKMGGIRAYPTDNAELKIILSKNDIDCDAELGIKVGEGDIKVGNMKMGMPEAEVKIAINTHDGDYSFETKVEIIEDLKVGFSVGWKDSKFDSVMLGADFDVPVWIDVVEVTFSDFKLGVTDISKASCKTVSDFLSFKLTGSCTASAYKLADMVPELKWLVGDASLLSLEDITLELCLGKPYISLGATTKFIGFIELGTTKYQIGTGLDYDNQLIELSGGELWGFVGQASQGITFDAGVLASDTKGTTTVAVTNEATGVSVRGDVYFYYDVWVKSDSISGYGDMFIGASKKHNGKWAFGFYAKSSSTKAFKKEFTFG